MSIRITDIFIEKIINLINTNNYNKYNNTKKQNTKFKYMKSEKFVNLTCKAHNKPVQSLCLYCNCEEDQRYLCIECFMSQMHSHQNMQKSKIFMDLNNQNPLDYY